MGGHLTVLRRTRVGPYDLSQAQRARRARGRAAGDPAGGGGGGGLPGQAAHRGRGATRSRTAASLQPRPGAGPGPVAALGTGRHAGRAGRGARRPGQAAGRVRALRRRARRRRQRALRRSGSDVAGLGDGRTLRGLAGITGHRLASLRRRRRGVPLAGPGRRARGLGQVRGHHRRVRRRAPRPSAHRGPGRRDRRRARAARGRDHLRPASRRGGPARLAPAAAVHRRAGGPSCWPGWAPTRSACCRSRSSSPGWARTSSSAPVLVDRLHAAARRGRRELPLRPPRRRRRGRCSPSWARSTTSPPRACRCCADDGITISSSLIREQLADGDVAGAARDLGRPHRVEGVVVRGQQRGRALGFPTANLETLPHTAIPADGVYAGWLSSLGEPEGQETRASAGRPRSRWAPTRPSTGRTGPWRPTRSTGTTWTCTALHVAVDFAARLRGMVRFDSVGGAGRADARATWTRRGRSRRAWPGTAAAIPRGHAARPAGRGCGGYWPCTRSRPAVIP